MTALVKLIIVSFLSLIGFSQTNISNKKDSVSEVRTEHCESHPTCSHASFQRKCDLNVYDSKINCTT